MLRKAVCAAAVLAITFSVASAEEFFGSITKIADGKITVSTKYDKAEKKFTEEKTLTVAKDVKVVNAKFNKEEKKLEAGEPLEGGLKNERFQNLGKGGVRAILITNPDNQVTEIRVLRGFGKKKKAE
jgi:hypothetical protein